MLRYAAAVVRAPRRLLRLLALGLLLLAGCDDSGDASPGTLPEPPEVASDLLVYRTDAPPPQLYKLDTLGRSTLLSDDAGALAVAPDYAVSPDNRYVAFAYRTESGQGGLAIRRLADGEPQQPAPVFDGAAPRTIAWQADSGALVYELVDETHAALSGLFLATLGQPEPRPLLVPESDTLSRGGFQLSTDGRRAAAVLQYWTDWDNPTAAAAELYLLDLDEATPPRLLARTAGDANDFQLAWSPFSSELLHQQRYRISSSDRFQPDDYPRGPLMLLDVAGESQALRAIDDPGRAAWTWLDTATILVAPPGRFEVITTDGSLLAAHEKSGPVAPSPDRRRLAFLDYAETGDPEVRMLDIGSGEYRVLGPGMILSFTFNFPYDSALLWSADGARLAWNRTPHYESPADALYVHDVAASRTRLVTDALRIRWAAPRFAWLPEGAALDYLASVEGGTGLVTTDLESGETLTIGEVPDPDCGLEHAWHSNDEVLWVRCGDGVIASRRRDGRFTDRRVLSWENSTQAYALALTGNRTLVVLQPLIAVEGETDIVSANWQVWDFDRGRLLELEGTGGTGCCGSLLQ